MGGMQIRNVALGSAADLMKNQEAHGPVAADKAFLRTIVGALQACPPCWSQAPKGFHLEVVGYLFVLQMPLQPAEIGHWSCV